ncbi:MAG: DEAD/DEAH box helicase [Rhodospirillales bacterium]|nr:DEAD/DEAH box helicase [Rhodospirillales bacterium]
MNFSDLGLSESVLRAVADAGYSIPTPIQEQAIPYVLMNRDVLASAQTGTGKTASFVLPMIDILTAGRAKARMPRSLILEPTRELAMQVAENFHTYGKHDKLTMALLIGGVSMGDQIKAIDRGPDVLIATPGRLLDMFERGRLLLNDVKVLVIDEADRMLDMGFIPDVERIVSLVSKMRQTLFFSATMPPEIRRLADAFLMNPKEISVAPPATPPGTVTHGLVMVEHRDGRRPGGGQKEKRDALRRLIRQEDVRNALVFCNRKRDVGILHRSLVRHGFSAAQLHGDLAQPVRTATLAAFRRGEAMLLVCSDVAARGLDIADMSHVFNFDVPSHAEDYIHRIGRTGRAGREGRAFTIATREDSKYLAAITQLIGKTIPPMTLSGDAPKATQRQEGPAEPKKQSRRDTPAPEGRKTKAAEPKSQPRRAAPASTRQEEEAARPEGPARPDGGRRDRAKPRDRKKERKAVDRPTEQRRKAEPPKLGMGDHTPAFMLRPVTRPKGRPDDEE